MKEELARQVRMGCNVSVLDSENDVEVVADFNDKDCVHLQFKAVRPASLHGLKKVEEHFAPRGQMYVELAGEVLLLRLRSVPQENLGVNFRMQLAVET